MPRYWIGIDPGTQTGFAVWDSEKRVFLHIATTTIVDAMRMALLQDQATIVMEDARQRKWIPREKSLSQFKGRAMGAGSVKRDCSIWEEFSDQYGIPLVLVPPHAGMTKWSPETFKKVTGWEGRTSNHARDAALLVFGK